MTWSMSRVRDNNDSAANGWPPVQHSQCQAQSFVSNKYELPRKMPCVVSYFSARFRSWINVLFWEESSRHITRRRRHPPQVTEWRNIAKTTVWFSSKMEKFMIQMTWPDDGVLDDVWVKASDFTVGLEAYRNSPSKSCDISGSVGDTRDNLLPIKLLS